MSPCLPVDEFFQDKVDAVVDNEGKGGDDEKGGEGEVGLAAVDAVLDKVAQSCAAADVFADECADGGDGGGNTDAAGKGGQGGRQADMDKGGDCAGV